MKNIMTEEQNNLAKAIRKMCELNYSRGGDEIVECFTDEEIVERFTSLEEAKRYCGRMIEAASNARWGEDTDPELARSKAFEEWEMPSEDADDFADEPLGERQCNVDGGPCDSCQ